MARFFNTAGPNEPAAGPNEPADHYTLPVTARLPDVRELIEQELYFVVHAPRQVGKTTALLNLGRELTAEGRYAAVLVTMEQGATFPHDPGAAELAVLGSWRRWAAAWLPPELQPPPWPDAPPGERFGAALGAWAQAAPRPLVVFLDEIDALQDETLISALRQIRSGYPMRPKNFPWSLALIGLRDVRDYKVASASDGRLGTASPFNIKVESLTMRQFTRDEVAELYGQHTAETGQVFLPEAVELAFHLSQGQPWLVNALARQLTQVLVKDRAQPITAAHVEEAKEILIRRQDTHLDSLMARLEEPRVRAIMEPMLAGDILGDVPEDDIRFALDLGLIRMDPAGGLTVANPIYREIIVRELAFTRYASLPQIPATWLTPDGRLDKDALLRAFLDFWRQHGEPLLASAPYTRHAPRRAEARPVRRGRRGSNRDDASAARRSECAGHLISWAGLCPRNDESAGKRRSTRVRQGASWLKTTLVQAACRSHVPIPFQLSERMAARACAVAATCLEAAARRPDAPLVARQAPMRNRKGSDRCGGDRARGADLADPWRQAPEASHDAPARCRGAPPRRREAPVRCWEAPAHSGEGSARPAGTPARRPEGSERAVKVPHGPAKLRACRAKVLNVGTKTTRMLLWCASHNPVPTRH